jgi:RNA polymerase sigma factor (sigma-70 family)
MSERTYYVNNDAVLAFMKTWKIASGEEKIYIENMLVKELAYLVSTRVKKYKTQPFYNDILQEARIGLINAIHGFDSSRSPNFFKYAVWKIQTNINSYLNWYERAKKSKIKTDIENILNPYEIFEKKECKGVLLNAVESLSKTDRVVIVMKFGLNGNDSHTLQEIGSRFSLSRQRIDQILSKALVKLKKNKMIKEIYC